MKKLKKGCFIYLIVMFVFITVFSIVDHFTPETDKAKRTVERAVEDMEEAETFEELNEIKMEIDTIRKNFPEHASLIDSLITDNIPVWEKQIAEEEADALLYRSYSVSKELVKKTLKSPSTAEFASYVKNEAKVWRDGNVYYCHFWVDAKNAFNATLRSNWKVKLKHDGNSFEILDVAHD